VAAPPARPELRSPGEPAAAALRLAPLAVAGALGLLYLPVFVHAAGVWRVDQELSFGFLLPPAAAFLVWFRRRRLRAALGEGSGVGLAALAGGLALFVAGARADVHALAAASFLPAVLGLTAGLYGTGAARVVLAPTALLTAGLSLYRGLLAPLGFALQELTARGAAAVAGLAGVPVRRSGMDLFTAGAHFVVAESCSGMDSLLALLSLGFLVVALASAAWPLRLLLLALVLPVVLGANVLRVAVVLALSQPFGAAAGEGLAHQALSAGVFLSASAVLWFACVLLRCQPRFDLTPSPSA
jgi:exosortase